MGFHVAVLVQTMGMDATLRSVDTPPSGPLHYIRCKTEDKIEVFCPEPCYENRRKRVQLYRRMKTDWWSL